MISGTSLEQADTTLRRAVVTLAPKRRSKFVQATEPTAESPVAAVSPLVRRPRMKRSGQMSLYWRTGSSELNAVRVSPEVLSAFHEALGALGKSPLKQTAHAAA